jgi:CBS domain-containing protein
MSPTATDLQVADLMSIEPITIIDDAPLAEAEQLMQQRSISGLPVVDAQGRLIGVLSQTDLVRAHVVEEHWNRWPGLSVRHLMTSPALTVSATARISEAAAKMERHHVHRLVVVDPEQRPSGVISTLDLVRALVEEG